MPEVCVSMPSYNQSHCLRDALESVLAQTSRAWETIIVDDGSADNRRAVAARFSDPRVRYICQENPGLSAARNSGIRAGQGRYLAFLDADDEWEPRLLEVCLRGLADRLNIEANAAEMLRRLDRCHLCHLLGASGS